MKKIVIAGSGFIGIEIPFSVSDDSDIIVIDHGKNFEQIKKKNPKIKCVRGDVNDANLIENLFDSCDIFFYCLDTGGVVDCENLSSKYYDINITKFKKLINILNKKNVKNFFLFSSGFIYPDIECITESTKPNPETFYGKLRLNQEQILKNSGLNYMILRLSNIFGYGHFVNLGKKGAIEKFIDNVFTKKNIILHGDGSQLVDYLHKSDLMNLIKNLTNNLPKKKIYNVASGERISIYNIAKIIKDYAKNEFGLNVEIIKRDEKTKLPNLPLTYPFKVMKATTWKPSTNIEIKIKEMMNICYLQNKEKIG